MDADAPREFVDASILVYAFDSSAARKQQAARQLLERLWASGTGCLSNQVLQEFFVTVTKKVRKPMPVDDARARIREFSAWTVFSPTADDIVAAIDLQTQARIGFWDAMIVLAAAESECDVVWTEDLNDGPRSAEHGDQYRHCKPILALGASDQLLAACGIDAALPSGKPDPGVIATSDASRASDQSGCR